MPEVGHDYLNYASFPSSLHLVNETGSRTFPKYLRAGGSLNKVVRYALIATWPVWLPILIVMLGLIQKVDQALR